ncbi:Membrane-bound lytic murein transglycosylase F [Sinobacterium norvegicum]|uniref:Membrane-bound lytic murein transglycosylase F n=1 Tax=Sinobacterium norvegicum TaxID=1641715 RepID=A0ABM9ACN9_9GAMM|nr:transporter substrate-binding domain-containing protein [Sinobacterium norvegicum]CAH0990449.1 Membrane-bound lytic murein transglycosylase F [Sinobacterium norvegicum]
MASNKNTLVLLALMLVVMLFGCSGDEEVAAAGTDEKVVVNEVYRGDLSAISQRGVLRIAGVKNDYAAELNRSGLPAVTYLDYADAFAKSLELTPVWSHYDDLSSALASADAGLSDLVMSNITVTETRRQRYKVDFSRPLMFVDEIIVGPREKVLQDYSEFAVTVDSSYLDTLSKTDYTLILLKGSTTEDEILDRISDEQDAVFTLMDDDLVAGLISSYPRLQTFGSLDQAREIGWAFRQQSPAFKEVLNQFLISSDLLFYPKEQRGWQQIKQSGVLRIATFNSPTTYYMTQGYHEGFEYDLLHMFAKQNGLEIRVMLVDNLEKLFSALAEGDVDIVAAGLRPTNERSATMQATDTYLYSKPFLLSKDDIENPIVALNPKSAYVESLLNMGYQVDGVPLSSSGSLAYRVMQGFYPSTVVNGHFAKLIAVVYPDVTLKPLSEEPLPHVWYHSKDDEFNQALNSFIKKEYRGKNYNILYKQYFEKVKAKNVPTEVVEGQPLSPYDDLFKKYADLYQYDWRLLAAQAFQESRFNAKATSHKGAKGLMQVMPRTGRSYGVTKLYDPEQSIIVASKHLRWLYDRFPTVKLSSEKLWFTLAAYNAGHGHIRDAMALARKRGLNDEIWEGNVEQAMLLLGDPKYYKQARYGYVRGEEPVAYVREIRERYRIYTHSH